MKPKAAEALEEFDGIIDDAVADIDKTLSWFEQGLWKHSKRTSEALACRLLELRQVMQQIRSDVWDIQFANHE